MRYCPDCGTGHECEGQAPAGPNPDVEIARINAERDKYVARVSARMGREELDTAETIAETQAEAEIVSAVAEAEIVGAAVEASDTEPDPLVIDAPPLDMPADEPDGEELPVAEEGSPAPEPAGRKARGLGMW